MQGGLDILKFDKTPDLSCLLFQFGGGLYPQSLPVATGLSLASFKLSSQDVRHPCRTPALHNCYSTRHSRRLIALQL